MRKSIALAVVIAASFALMDTPAVAGPVHSASTGVRPDQLRYGFQQTLRGIRNAALKQQVSDGGTLTAEHLAKFQRKLDRANDLYHRQLVNNNPLNVDADGRRNSVTSSTDWTWSNLIQVGAFN